MNKRWISESFRSFLGVGSAAQSSVMSIIAFSFQAAEERMRRSNGYFQKIIALITPDELAVLRPELHREHDNGSDRQRWQARPNVLFEAGMAFALAGEERTLILVAGCAELFSDVIGFQCHRIPGNAIDRELLKKTLVTMGCRIRDTPHHHGEGNFVAGPLYRLETRWPFA